MRAYENLNKDLVNGIIEVFKKEFKKLPMNKFGEIDVDSEEFNTLSEQFDKSLEAVGVRESSYDWICAYEDVM